MVFAIVGIIPDCIERKRRRRTRIGLLDRAR